jgi:methylated-DNA-[protein]-cysteine S-methyltransferase
VTASPVFHLERVASPIGCILLVSDGDGRVVALDFETHEARMHRLLKAQHGAGRFTLASGAGPAAVTARIHAYFAGELGALDGVEVRTGGTAFERTVWSALRRIPVGTTTTYGRLAAAIGRPSASRAVGRANGNNPVGIVVPCHRVIGADGSLTGYGGGVERKRWLLEHEMNERGTGTRRS